MQIEKGTDKRSLTCYPKNVAFQLFMILQYFTSEMCYFLKK